MLRPHHREVHGHEGEVRRRVRGVRPGNRPTRYLRVAPVLVVRQPELHRLPLWTVLLPAAHRRHGRHHRRALDPRRRPAVPRALRPSRLRSPRSHVHLGQLSSEVQHRRLLRPLGHRPHEARHEDRHGGPEGHVAGHQVRAASARAPRHRRRPGPGHDEGHHRRGPVRPRVRRQLVLRLRRAEGACGRVRHEARVRDHVGARRQDRRGRPHAGQRQELHAAVGRGRGHDPRGHAGRSGHPGPLGDHGQHGAPGRHDRGAGDPFRGRRLGPRDPGAGAGGQAHRHPGLPAVQLRLRRVAA